MRDVMAWVGVAVAAAVLVPLGAGSAHAYKSNISYTREPAPTPEAAAQTTSAPAVAKPRPARRSAAPAASRRAEAESEPAPRAWWSSDWWLRMGPARKGQGKYHGARTNKWRELALDNPPDALQRLLQAVQHYPAHRPPNSVLDRRNAAEALGVLGDPRGIPALEEALNDPDFLVRHNAAQALLVLHRKTQY